MTHNYAGRDHDLAIKIVRERAAIERPLRRLEWERTVQDASESWRQYRPLLRTRRGMLHDTRAMIRVVVEWRLLLMFSGLLVGLERMERSAMIVKILASPSGAGPQRYAQPWHRRKQ